MVVVVSREAVLECCSCAAFAEKLAAPGSYSDVEEIIRAAREIWWNQVWAPSATCVWHCWHPLITPPQLLQTPVAGWLEAFAAHPLIGDVQGLRKKFGAFAEMSQGEQGTAAATATEATLQARRNFKSWGSNPSFPFELLKELVLL